MNIAQHRHAQIETGNVMQYGERDCYIEQRIGKGSAPVGLGDVGNEKISGDVAEVHLARQRNRNQLGRCVHTHIARAFALALQPFCQSPIAATHVENLASIANVRYNSVEACLRAGTRFRKRGRELGIEFAIDRNELLDDLLVHCFVIIP